MQAIILAAGRGKRLHSLTEHNTKCMVEINGITLIERMLKQLDDKGLSKIILVVGYKKNKLIDFVKTLNISTKIVFVENEIYDKTNNIYSLYLTKEFLCREETVIIESDIIFENGVLDLVINNDGNNTAILDKYKCWMTGMGVELDERQNITSFLKENSIDHSIMKQCYKTIGIYKFQKEFSKKYYVPFLEGYLKAYGKNSGYEQVLRILSMLDEGIVKAKLITDKYWYEINDIQDIDLASTLFSENEDDITSMMLGRWGGYWRYPDYLDYFYLVTPYYPPKNMIEEMKANFEDLLAQYPSSMKVNALLAAKEFAVFPENIVIGNGAAELIKSIMERIEGRTGFIRPTFEEYANRYSKLEEVSMFVNPPDFTYTADDVMGFFEDKELKNLVLINPDNPSGNFIRKKDMLRIFEWAKKRNIKVIVDESFVDFATDKDTTLIEQKILNKFPNLYVIKSISKSYGIPGLRLGVLASGDLDSIAFIKKDVAIWNINSFAEFYMQIAGKYQKDYHEALDRFRNERIRFQGLLDEIDDIRVIPSEANYFMIELLNGINADNLKKRMLIDKKVFIKSLSKKIKSDKQYIRIAIRNEEENNKFLQAFKDCLKEIKK